MNASGADGALASPQNRVTLLTIFLVFLRTGLIAFGGGLSGWIYREIVTVRRWVTDDEFFSAMAVAQIMPGANVTNLAVFVGQRLANLPGAAVALAGLVSGPFVAAIVLASLYSTIEQIGWTRDALEGVAAGAVGLIIVVSGKGAKRASGHIAAIVAMVATFVTVGVLRFPLVPSALVIGALSVIAAMIRRKWRA